MAISIELCLYISYIIIHALSLYSVVRKRNISDDQQSSTLFVGHLPYDMDASELRSYFPGSTDARILSDRYSGISKGYTIFFLFLFWSY